MSSPESKNTVVTGRDRVSKMARLARLKLEPAEVEAYANQLESILGYIDQLKSVDITDVAPMLSPVAAIGAPVVPLREDLVGSPDLSESARVVACGPEISVGAFVVPPVL
jgi:aspartyl-tRNA(Asn)/glutamyl-tRNA(Gln) amidotransferase subunit C